MGMKRIFITLFVSTNLCALSSGQVEECPGTFTRWYCIWNLDGNAPVADNTSGYLVFNKSVTTYPMSTLAYTAGHAPIGIRDMQLHYPNELWAQSMRVYDIDGQWKVAVESRVSKNYTSKKIADGFIFVKSKVYPGFCFILAYNLSTPNISGTMDTNDIGVLFTSGNQLLVSAPTMKPQTIKHMLWKLNGADFTCHDIGPVIMLKSVEGEVLTSSIPIGISTEHAINMATSERLSSVKTCLPRSLK